MFHKDFVRIRVSFRTRFGLSFDSERAGCKLSSARLEVAPECRDDDHGAAGRRRLSSSTQPRSLPTSPGLLPALPSTCRNSAASWSSCSRASSRRPRLRRRCEREWRTVPTWKMQRAWDRFAKATHSVVFRSSRRRFRKPNALPRLFQRFLIHRQAFGFIARLVEQFAQPPPSTSSVARARRRWPFRRDFRHRLHGFAAQSATLLFSALLEDR